jgi:hypothetical protein
MTRQPGENDDVTVPYVATHPLKHDVNTYSRSASTTS